MMMITNIPPGSSVSSSSSMSRVTRVRSSSSSSAGPEEELPTPGDGVEVMFFTNKMCPYSQRNWMMLEEKDVSYSVVEIDLEDKPAYYQTYINPNGKVPAILVVENKNIITDSRDIDEYLAKKYQERGNQGLWPETTQGQLKAKELSDIIDNNLAGAFWSWLSSSGADVEEETSLRSQVESVLETIEQRFFMQSDENANENVDGSRGEGGGGPWLLGDTFTIADIEALPFVDRLHFALNKQKGWTIPARLHKLNKWLNIKQHSYNVAIGR